MARRKLSVVALAALVVCATFSSADGVQFTAGYAPLASSPLTVGTSWYSGAVTNDGKFIYGLGHSHNSYGDNSIWEFNPATNTHKNLFPSTGNKWKWTNGVDNSGHWDTLDPVADKALYAFFGGPTIKALTNRNNHQAFYVPARNEFWVVAGTTFYQSSPYFAGRFSLDTNRWVNLSKDLTQFSAGLIAGTGSWVSPNAATAVCKDLNTVVLFGGMSSTGGVVMIEPNPVGPEPYRWASAPKPPIWLPAENVRHNAVCVGDTVYFVSGQERVARVKCCRTPNPGPFWKFHVPTRSWTRLTDGPPGGYFPTLTYDSDANALLYYGGSASNALWMYDLITQRWTDLTGTVPDLPRADMHAGGFVPGFGHVFKGGKQYDARGESEGYSAGARMSVVRLTPSGKRHRAAPTVSSAPTPATSIAPTLKVSRSDDQAKIPVKPDIGNAPDPGEGSGAWRGGHPPTSSTLSAIRRGEPLTAVTPTADPPTANAPRHIRQSEKNGHRTPSRATPQAVARSSSQTGGRLVWTKIPLPGWPNSPQGSQKHQRMVEGPGGRVWILGGDWGGGPHNNTGRQEVYSFDPLSTTGDWRQEAPYGFPVESPQRIVHFHTDEAGVAWDAKRGVFWKLAGTVYGPKDEFFTSGRSVKAKVIQFDPKKREWRIPEGFEQRNFWYVTNGVLDPIGDQMVQITDKAAWHLDLSAGTWKSYALPGGVLRFNAIAARLDRDVWFLNRNEVLESYNLDTHTLSGHGPWPWPRSGGWATAMTFALENKILLIWPTSLSTQQKHAALYDPAKKQWTTLEQGAARGNTGMLHSNGRVILMGGMAPPEEHNKFVWVGSLQ